MAVLSDGTIREMLDTGELAIEPIDREKQIRTSSVDLTLGREIIPETNGIKKEYDDEITFYPKQSYLAHVQETIRLPPYLSADVKGRSSIGRMFLQIHCAGWADAGWEGELTLEITNLGNNPKTLNVGDRVCQIVFHRLDRSAEEPYGEKSDSKYQDQTGATPTRLED